MMELYKGLGATGISRRPGDVSEADAKEAADSSK
jgi:hypothetical protein